MTPRIPVVACSGIGKSLGAAAREAAFILTEDLRPEEAKITALGLLVLGDEETGREVAGGPAIAVDGCKLACAAKGLEVAGASDIRKVAIYDIVRRHRGLKPEGICDLNEDGLALARAAAEEGAALVDELQGRSPHA
jgi:uncharacterized metal-binding protein